MVHFSSLHTYFFSFGVSFGFRSLGKSQTSYLSQHCSPFSLLPVFSLLLSFLIPSSVTAQAAVHFTANLPQLPQCRNCRHAPAFCVVCSAWIITEGSVSVHVRHATNRATSQASLVFSGERWGGSQWRICGGLKVTFETWFSSHHRLLAVRLARQALTHRTIVIALSSSLERA